MHEPTLVHIPAGPVTLGTPAFPPGTRLPHAWRQQELFVPAFAIATTAVTVGEMLAFAAESDYPVADELRSDPRFQNPRAPAAFVSWIDAVRYVQALARQSGKPYRLARDAEYEKAARGGLAGRRFPWGDEDPVGRADWHNGEGAPQPVGSYPANGFGLHDMVGSIWSWCEECFNQVVADDRARMCYDDTALRDVRMNAICRGGSFKSHDPVTLWCAHRHEDPTDGRFDCIGFRMALSVAG